MARYFTETDIDEFRECFYLFARSGQINTLDELTIVMRSLGMSPTIGELNKYLKDKGGKMSFADFLDVMHAHSKAEQLPKEVIDAFRAVDPTKKGQIPARHLKHLLLHWGERLSQKEVEQIFREANITPNGTVCRELLTDQYKKMNANPIDDRAVEYFRSYLRIQSVQPDVDYSECITFLTKLAEDIGLDYSVLQLHPKKPLIIVTLKGTRPDLPAIALNSHMDVVPVFPEFWTHDPFGAEMDDKGNIYARGAQDMKCLTIEYLEALRTILRAGIKPKRTVHLLIVPDEEEGIDGLEQLVNSQYFKPLNIGFALDEGEANPDEEFLIYYAEKAIWQVKFHIKGTDGHGSLALPNTAGEKLRILLDQAMEFRQSKLDFLAANPSLDVGNVTFLNLTEVSGGSAPNVVPPELTATIDIRLAVDEDHTKFEALLQQWCDAAGGATMEFISKEPSTPATPIDETNPYWVAVKETFENLKQPIKTLILPGGTDSRFLRRAGIPCICFSPNNLTEYRAHANDEYLNKDIFLRGITVYTILIIALTNLEESEKN